MSDDFSITEHFYEKPTPKALKAAATAEAGSDNLPALHAIYQGMVQKARSHIQLHFPRAPRMLTRAALCRASTKHGRLLVRQSSWLAARAAALQIVANERRKGAFVEIDGFKHVHSMPMRRPSQRAPASLRPFDYPLYRVTGHRLTGLGTQNEWADLERRGRRGTAPIWR